MPDRELPPFDHAPPIEERLILAARVLAAALAAAVLNYVYGVM